MDAYIWFIDFTQSLKNVWDWLNTPIIADTIITPLSLLGIGTLGAILIAKLLKVFNPLS